MRTKLLTLAIVLLAACQNQTAPRTSNYRCEKTIYSADSAFLVPHVLNYTETYYLPYPYEYKLTEFQLEWYDVWNGSQIVNVYGIFTYKTSTGRCLSTAFVEVTP